MVEQFGAINSGGLLGPSSARTSGAGAAGAAGGGDFKSLLMDSIKEVNQLQTEADEAMVNLATKKTDNVAEVFTAVKKAELAFNTLMQIRNKLEEAYDEIKQMRV